jgi:hypothetical protein
VGGAPLTTARPRSLTPIYALAISLSCLSACPCAQGVLRFEGTVLKPDDTPLSALDAADLIAEEDEEEGEGQGLPAVQLDLFVPPPK